MVSCSLPRSMMSVAMTPILLEKGNMAVSVNICQYHSQSSDPSSILTVGSRNIMYSFCRVAVSPYLTPSLLGIL